MSYSNGDRVPRRRVWRAVGVLAATAIVAAASVTAFARARQSAEELQQNCQSNLKQYALGILMYVQDYDEHYPPMKLPGQVQNRLFPYVKNRAVFTCPVTKTAYLPNPALNYLTMGKVASPATMVMFRDDKPHVSTSGRPAWNVAYADGHVKLVTIEPKLGKAAPSPPPPARSQHGRKRGAHGK